MVNVGSEAHEGWSRLWQLGGRLAEEFGGSPELVFSDIGLLLANPAGPVAAGGYDSSPAGGAKFASTGGDGVHFSFLPVSHGGATPVVMTVPMQWDSPNVVVGGDLREFLALGCATGYFVLEQLAYEGAQGPMVATLQASRLAADSSRARIFQALAGEFDLRPWPDVAGRLAALNVQYRPHIRPAS